MSDTTPHTGEHRDDLTTVVVTGRQQVADEVVALTLAAAGGGDLPPWSPGAHVDLLLTDDLVRQYSLSGTPADRSTYRVGVLREPVGRGGSAWVHDHLTEGTGLTLRGPRNNFRLLPSPTYLFVAGGVGITPLLPMIAQAQAGGASWRLLYGGRSLSSMAFTDELQAHGDRVTLVPQDRDGLPDLDALLGTPLTDTLVYACGPEGLLEAVERRCAGWPPGSLHVERFSARPGELDDSAGDRFEVECRTSGLTVTVEPGRSILETVHEAGVEAASSCQEGVCGTCETAVLEGVPDHRDSILSPEERAANDYMMICVSRCMGDRLVLDL